MRYYPAYLDLRDRPCVVLGGGAVSERKALSLLEAGADVTIVSPTLTPKLQELSDSGKIDHLPRIFNEQDLSGAYLVIAATDSPEENIRASDACKKRRVLVNCAAPPEAGNFIVPSMVDRGDLLIAVSTSGASPALSRKIRKELEERYGPAYEQFLARMENVRKRVLEETPDEDTRRKIFETIVESDVLDLLRQGKVHEADHRMTELAGLKHRG